MCVLSATLAGPKLEKAPLQADLQADVTCNGSDSAIVIGEFTRGYFFAFFFLELQLTANRGGRNLCNINLSWEKRRE